MSNKPPRAEATEGFGSDSFLDVVANMVGILIILVMVVGMRIRHEAKGEPEPPAPEIQTAEKVLAPLRTQRERLQKDFDKLRDEMGKLYEISSMRYDEREQLGYDAAEAEEILKQRRARLASGEQEAFDIRQAVLMEETRLKDLEAKIRFLSAATPQAAVKIKTYPTPLSRTVHGREAHFQLLGGKIVYVPLNELVDEVKREVQTKAYRLRDLAEITETVGPIGNFRLRYTLERIDIPNAPAGQSLARTKEMTMVPTSSDLGETLEQAMAERSDFRRTMSDIDPKRVTVTFWTYPDSFEAYRKLRELLYEKGYTVAGRPLPTGQPISGSPHGSKTAAQ
jgi:predicted RNase H-like nuclease (RuvC/YqgF family)